MGTCNIWTILKALCFVKEVRNKEDYAILMHSKGDFETYSASMWQRWVVTLDCKYSWRKVWGDENVDRDWHPGYRDVCTCQTQTVKLKWMHFMYINFVIIHLIEMNE